VFARAKFAGDLTVAQAVGHESDRWFFPSTHGRRLRFAPAATERRSKRPADGALPEKMRFVHPAPTDGWYANVKLVLAVG
jgi:hypothetical protein